MSERLLSEIQKLRKTYPHNDQILLISALVQELTNHLEGLNLRIQKQKEVILNLQERVEAAEREGNEALGFIASKIPTIEALSLKSDVAKIMKSEHLQALNKFAIEQQIKVLEELIPLSGAVANHWCEKEQAGYFWCHKNITDKLEQLRQQLNKGE